MPDDSAEPVNVVLNVEYNQILTLPLTMPNNILWIWVPFNWQNLSFLIMPSLSGGSATLVWEMAANGSVTSSGGRALMSPKAFEIMDPTSSANGSIGVPLTVTGLQPTTAAIVVNLTLALSLQMPASDSSSSFTGYYAMVQQNPTNTASNFVIPFTDTGTASALSAPASRVTRTTRAPQRPPRAYPPRHQSCARRRPGQAGG